MQWLINEFKAFKEDVKKRIDDAFGEHIKKQIECAERVTKLEGEIRAMKARAGKKQDGA